MKKFKGEFIDLDAYDKIIGFASHNSNHSAMEREFFNGLNSTENSKCIILLRNPYHSFLSAFTKKSTEHWNTARAHSHYETAEEFHDAFVNDKDVMSWIETEWLSSYVGAYNACTGSAEKQILIVYYEDLKFNLVETLRTISKFLEQYDVERFVRCVIDEKLEDEYQRKYHLEIDPFSDGMKLKILEIVHELNKTIALPDRYLTNL